MNGVASQAMRQAGNSPDYRLNFGVEIPRLKGIADDICAEFLKDDTFGEKAEQLANALWKEQVRECRIMATMVYPPKRMDEQMAQTWVEQIRGVEMARYAAMYLFSKITHSSEMALRWMANDNEMLQITGFYTMIHLIRERQLNQRAIDEVRDHATVAVESESLNLKTAAVKMLDALDDNVNQLSERQ